MSIDMIKMQFKVSSYCPRVGPNQLKILDMVIQDIELKNTVTCTDSVKSVTLNLKFRNRIFF